MLNNTSPSFEIQEEMARLLTQEMLQALRAGLSPALTAKMIDPENIIGSQERLIIENKCRKILAAGEII